MNTAKIGKFIAKKRIEQKLTQKALANKLSVTDRAVSKWERGVGCPDISLLEKISKELNISVIELLKGEEVNNIKEETIIDTIKTSSKIGKYQVKKNINIILTTIIIFITSILIILNIQNIKSLNKKTYYDFSTIKNRINNINDYYNIIMNNQGIYSNEDYQIIKEYVNEMLQKIKLNKFENGYYSLIGYYKIYQNYQENFLNSLLDINTPYAILLKYDLNIYKNMIIYYIMCNLNNNTFYEFEKNILNMYEYKYDLTNNDNITFPSISSLYITELNLLKDIIEVGDLDV